MEAILPERTAELLDQSKRSIGRVRVAIWKRRINGFVDWGGGIEPIGNLPAIEPGIYLLRLDNQGDAQIIVNGVRRASASEQPTLTSATFLGNSQAPE